MIDTTDDFEDSDETDTTVQQYQEHFGNLYDLGFRLISNVAAETVEIRLKSSSLSSPKVEKLLHTG